MFKLPHNCTNFTYQQGNVQNPSSQASAVHEPRASRCTSWLQKRQRNQRLNCQYPLDHRKSKGIPEKISTSASLTKLKPLTVWITTNCRKILKEMGIPDNLTCLLRNLYAGQEAAVRSGHGRMDWFQIGKGVLQGCMLSPCLFKFYAKFCAQSLSCVQLFMTPQSILVHTQWAFEKIYPVIIQWDALSMLIRGCQLMELLHSSICLLIFCSVALSTVEN